MKNKILVFVVCVMMISLGAVLLIGENTYADCGDVETTIIDCGDEDPICHILNLVVEIMTIGIGILGVIGIVIAGIQYLTGGGNEEKIRKAKRRLFELVIGVALYVVLTSVIAWLNPGGLFCGGTNSGGGDGGGTDTANTVAGFSDVKEGAYYAEAVEWAKNNGIMNGVSDTSFGSGKNTSRQDAVTALWRAAGQPNANGKKAEDCYSDAPKEGVYYSEALAWACSTGYIQGYSNKAFGVGDNMTRLQFVTVLWRVAGSPTGKSASGFSDVPKGAEDAVNWAVAEGIVSGGGTNFNPSQNIPREQVATMLYRRYK